MTCTWEPDPACLTDEWDALSPEEQERYLSWATSSLQMLTLYRVGTCPVTVRPCPSERRCGCGWNPRIYDGVWYNDCPHRTQCSAISEVELPGPVGYIERILVDGVPLVINDQDFRLDEGYILVWQGDGPSPFPETQDLNKPDSAVGTWSITYSRSYPVTDDAKVAVTYLALEFAKACQPSKKCKLPRGVTSVVRSGVSFTIEAGLFPNGLTGIDLVDRFILKWAPAGAPLRNATVFDPRTARMRRTNRVPVSGNSAAPLPGYNGYTGGY